VCDDINEFKWTGGRQCQKGPAEMTVQQKIDQIKQSMPETYKAIQEKAKQIGNDAYLLVRRGLRGEPNCFWAMEGGLVMGTPFNLPDTQRDVAWAMVCFGCAHACIFCNIRNGVH
jgi:tRNA A37 methylthiotransferase MiaB